MMTTSLEINSQKVPNQSPWRSSKWDRDRLLVIAVVSISFLCKVLSVLEAWYDNVIFMKTPAITLKRKFLLLLLLVHLSNLVLKTLESACQLPARGEACLSSQTQINWSWNVCVENFLCSSTQHTPPQHWKGRFGKCWPPSIFTWTLLWMKSRLEWPLVPHPLSSYWPDVQSGEVGVLCQQPAGPLRY